MPKKDTITYGTVKESAVNLHFKVGAGGDNGIADVMLIQTLFRYIGKIGQKAMYNIGLQLHELPAIDGICGRVTKNAILKFQRKNASKVLAVDGLIEPASYEGRTIRAGEPRVMTMTLLHFLALEMQAYHPEPSYIDTLIKMTPQLRPWLS